MIRQLKIEHVVALALVSLGLAAIFNFARTSFAPKATDSTNVVSHQIFEVEAQSDKATTEQLTPPVIHSQEYQLAESEPKTWESVEAVFRPPDVSKISGMADSNVVASDNTVVWDSLPTPPQTIKWNYLAAAKRESGQSGIQQVDSAVAELSDEDRAEVFQATLQRKNLKPFSPEPVEPEDPFQPQQQLNLNAPSETSVESLIPVRQILKTAEGTNSNGSTGNGDANINEGFAAATEQENQPPTKQLPSLEAKDDNSFDPGFHNSQSSSRVPARLVSSTKRISPPLPTPVITPKVTPTATPKTPPEKEPPASGNTPRALVGTDSFVMAGQPAMGDHWKDDRPITDPRAYQIETIKDDFSPDPNGDMISYDAYEQMDIYEGKTLNSNQRPILEIGRPWYQLGQLSPGSSVFGKHNQVTPQFLLYGDWRTAVASNTQNGNNVSQVAFEVNLDFDLKITSTERFHMFMSPVDDGNNTRYLLDDDEFINEFDADIDFGYFEGDMGAIVGGFINQTLPFDMPFAVGVMPLLLQNGVWMEDAFLGIATTIPARNSARLGISNMDFTFFAGYDKIDSDAFLGDDSAARMYGMASFIEAMNGYFEIDYAYFDDRTFEDRSYHNIGFGFTRRFGRLLSNSTRVIVNAGQQSAVNTADGVLLLSENSLITRSPSTLVPYMNFFAGFDRPQSAARAGAAGGVLRNTGLLFESDGMTNYPTLDPTANDTFGGAFGLNLIADDFSQQLVVEMAALGVMNEDANRNAPGAQYGIAFRYQLPISNAVIIRMDGMYGFLENSEDVSGLRLELRHKY